MNVFVVLAHPERRSFNAAMFDTAVETLSAAGHAVMTSDLYRMASTRCRAAATSPACATRTT